ncbi:hypothetical protein [Pseudomonas sp. NPDC086251]|uniref:hypothetical protein n=1 Tax=Pseudomonas sp. NPDC086251 TaxID=3364431 RepID=UPI00383451C8
MALISCPGCGLHESDKAWHCSGCGQVLRVPKRGPLENIFKWSFILFNPCMAGWMIYELATAGITSFGFEAMVITALWVIGDINLGLLVLLTRPRKYPLDDLL